MENRFKFGETVLARQWDGDIWEPILYARYDEKADWGFCHVSFGGSRYRRCIPLKGNENLMGTAQGSPDELLWNVIADDDGKAVQRPAESRSQQHWNSLSKH